MAILKCKMCGGNLEVPENSTICECEYCGSMQTLPKLDNDKKNNLYDRANHFRRNNEYDKAMGIYEQILNEDRTDAEAYWSLVLCRYGIEYVEDPMTHKRIPTVNRAQFTSVFDDSNYKSALEYADSYQKSIYEEEARVINEIQKGILAISQREEPFDVFICYKESDNNGRRTPDSVLANDLYHQLTQEGFKVFFSRITLEDKLGSAYEPYIFAALNSAKVMVVLGTRPEYFKAVWVKNEWSRYLAMIKAGEKKMLIPAYKDMDPYDLPEEFSHLQAQDMSKLGFMQDLIRGIKKIVGVEDVRPIQVSETMAASGNANIAPLLKRAFMFLEDAEWESADEYCEKVLDMDPENAQAYVGKLMAELYVRTRSELADYREKFDKSNSYQKAVRFADKKLKVELEGYINAIEERIEEKKRKVEEEVQKKAKKEIEILEKEETYFWEKISEWGNEIKEIEKNKKEKYENRRLILEEELNEINRCIEEYQNEINGLSLFKLSRKKELWDLIKIKEECKRAIKQKIEELNDTICLEYSYPKCPYIKEKNREKQIEEYIQNQIPEYMDNYKKEKLLSKIIDSQKGDIISYGHYFKNKTSNVKKNIKWIVLERYENKILVISKDVLDCKQYHSVKPKYGATWEICDLRKWLNTSFISVAFSELEEKMISTATVTADINPSHADVKQGNNTKDRVFLLSIKEVNTYLKSKNERQCTATNYVLEKGVYETKGYCNWWLRTSGLFSGLMAAYVDWKGEVQETGSDILLDNLAIRPAMWIDLEL